MSAGKNSPSQSHENLTDEISLGCDEESSRYLGEESSRYLDEASYHSPQTTALSSSVGNVVGLTECGAPLVDFPENKRSPIVARSAVQNVTKEMLEHLPLTVLLVFEGSDTSKPIISGIVGEKFVTAGAANMEAPNMQTSNTIGEPKTAADNAQLVLDAKGKSSNVIVDGKRLTLDAQDEIMLRCGKSSILLRKDGKIVIKGTNLISRSSAANKIKGSSVSIN